MEFEKETKNSIRYKEPDDVANTPVENLYIKKSAFQGKARNPSLFRQVRVDPELGTIVWPNGADIAPETLHGGFLERPGDRPKAASA